MSPIVRKSSEQPENPHHANLLVAIAEHQDQESFIQIFDYYAPRIKSFLMRSGMDPDQAEELMQETMLSVWHKAGHYNPDKAAASTWLYTIARNKKIDYLRKAGRPNPDPNDPYFKKSQSEAQDDDIKQLQDSKAISRAIKALPDNQAELVRKAFFEDKTHQEIAKETDIPLGTVKSRIRLALEKLQDALNTKVNPRD